MHSILDIRKAGFFWWSIVTALVFLIPQAWLIAAASFLRSADWLQKDKPPVIWLVDLRNAIDSAALGFPAIVQFKPAETLVTIGSVQVPNLAVGVFIGTLLILGTLLLYRYTSARPGVLDDLLAMVLVYIVLRVVGVATEGVPVVKFLNDRAPTSYLIIMLIFMVFLIFRGRAAKDSKVFFKLLLEVILVSMLILPRQTLDALAWLVEFPTKIHQFIAGTQIFVAIVAGWAMVGLVLGITNLYNVGKSAPPAKSPADGEKAQARRQGGE